MFSSKLVHSFLGIKGISKMICHVKFIFALILLVPELTGNVFYGDFVRNFLCLLSFFRV